MSEPAPAESVRDRFFDAAVVAGFILSGTLAARVAPAGSGLCDVGHRAVDLDRARDLLGHIQPFPSPADFFFLASIPLALIGLLLFPRRRPRTLVAPARCSTA